MNESRTESRIPRILELAPNFEAKSTHGLIRLDDYTSQGKWVMLFSHPSDFTPVCSTELIEFARRSKEFDQLQVQLIGLSIDSVYAHIAWLRDLEHLGGVKITFPLIADLDQRVSQAYGMVHEAVNDTAAVRAVFFIDPKGQIRALLYYPMQLGRNVDELLRIVQGLQAADANEVSCPANWQVGDAVIVPAPATLEAARERTEDRDAGFEVQSWYLSKRTLTSPAK